MATATAELYMGDGKIYTPEEVRLRLKKAFQTLRRLPDNTPRDRIGSLETRYNRMADRNERWTEALAVIESGAHFTTQHVRRKATPQEIDDMDRVLEWTMMLDTEARSLLWAMAAARRGDVGIIAKRLGVKNRTVRWRHREALIELAGILNG